jgi:hypothetical protein
MLQINTHNEIIVDGKNTGMTVKQTSEKTLVRFYYHSEVFELPMRHKRYSLVTDNPASGIAGLSQFEKDIREYLVELT